MNSSRAGSPSGVEDPQLARRGLEVDRQRAEVSWCRCSLPWLVAGPELGDVVGLALRASCVSRRSEGSSVTGSSAPILLDLNAEGHICAVRDMGMRIFPHSLEPQRKESLAAGRRAARSNRRNRDRYKSRQRRLLEFMTEHGLMPDDEGARKALELKDPYELRAKALDEKLSLPELGRALFHINQRRGFKSNRKTDTMNSERGAIKEGVARLEHLLRTTNSRTLGEYLAGRNRRREGTRARRDIVDDTASYEFYPSRAMYEHELDLILQKQRTFHPGLIGAIGAELKAIILYQRPLKAPPPGRCILEAGENRARIAYPALQTLRILKQVNALEIINPTDARPPLTQAERQLIIDKLQAAKRLTFPAIRHLLKGGKEAAFNFEAEKHKDLQGNVTGYYLAGEACFGERWRELSEERQNAVVDLILEETDSEEAIRILVTDYGLSPEQAEKALNAALDEDRASVSLRAAHKILPHLKAGCRYGEAREKAGYPAPGSFREGWRELPYYGEALPEAATRGTYAPEDRAAPEIFYGRTPNATLHVALNQIRKLVNAIIALHGPPAEAIVHLAPELKVGRKLAAWQQKTEQASRERTDSALLLLGLTPTPETRLQYRLWQDQAPVTNSWHERIVRDYLGCIAPCRVYGESDHLIALLRHKWGVDALIRDAMRGKLKALLPSKGGRHDLLDWILDEENTEAPLYFQQVVDAAVIGSVTPGLFQTVARECARMFADPRFRENPPGPAEALPLPFPGYREQIGDRLEGMVVSYKPDHGNASKAIHSPHPYTVAQLHQLMAYGLAAPRPDKPTALYVTRWPVADFIRLADIEAVADPGLRQKMLAAVEGLKDGSTQFKKALAAFAQSHGVRRLRVHLPRSPETMIPVYQRHEKGTEGPSPTSIIPAAQLLRGGLLPEQGFGCRRMGDGDHFQLSCPSERFHSAVAQGPPHGQPANAAPYRRYGGLEAGRRHTHWPGEKVCAGPCLFSRPQAGEGRRPETEPETLGPADAEVRAAQDFRRYSGPRARSAARDFIPTGGLKPAPASQKKGPREGAGFAWRILVLKQIGN